MFLLFSGSFRTDSLNKKLLRVAQHFLTEKRSLNSSMIDFLKSSHIQRGLYSPT